MTPRWPQLALAGAPSSGGDERVEHPSLGIGAVSSDEGAVARDPGSAGGEVQIEAAAPLSADDALRSAGVEADVRALYVSAQLADPANTVAASVDGLLGRIDARVNLDAQVAWRVELPSEVSLRCFIAGKNLTNQVYVASRSPAGIQPAGFFTVLGGIDVGW